MIMWSTRFVRSVCTLAAAPSLASAAGPVSAGVAPSFSQGVVFGDASGSAGLAVRKRQNSTTPDTTALPGNGHNVKETS